MEDQYFVAHDDKRHTSCEDEIHKKPSKKLKKMLRRILVAASYGFVFMLGFILCFFTPLKYQKNPAQYTKYDAENIIKDVSLLRTSINQKLEIMNQSMSHVIRNVKDVKQSIVKHSEDLLIISENIKTKLIAREIPEGPKTKTTTTLKTTKATLSTAKQNPTMVLKNASKNGDEDIRLSCKGSISRGDIISLSMIKYIGVKGDQATLEKSQTFCNNNFIQEGDYITCVFSLKRAFQNPFNTGETYVEYKCYE